MLKIMSLKKNLLIVSFLLLVSNVFWGQTIAPGGSYTQNFDAIGTTAAAALPSGWKVENITGARTISNAYTSVTGTATVNSLAYNTAMSSTAGNGIYNFGSGASSGNQSIGGISSASASQSVNMFLKLTNSSSSSSIPSFTISYTAKRFRNGSNTAGFSIRLYYSTTGAANSWTEISSGIASFTANGGNLGSTTNPLETKLISNVSLAQSLAASGSIYLAWSYSVTSGSTTSNAQALGIDDITVTAASSTPTLTPFTLTSSLSNTYGTASSGVSFTASGTNLSGNITATAQSGYEVSTSSGSGYAGSVSVSSGTVVYVRHAATKAVGSDDGSTAVVLSSSGATSVNVTTSSSGNVVTCSSPSAPTAGNASRCGTGAVTISASPSTGETIDWYSASSSGTALSTGATSYTTPSISSSTTFYAEARNTTTGCLSATRTTVTATVNPLPTPSISATYSKILNGASTTLSTTSSYSSYSWSNSITNASATYTPSSVGTSTYYVTVTDANSCTGTASKSISVADVVLPSGSITGAVEQFTDANGWTYYGPNSSSNDLYFAIKKNGNTLTATVDITVDNAPKISIYSNVTNQGHASVMMARSWNVNATILSGSNAMSVRFFHLANEITDIQDSVDSITKRMLSPSYANANTNVTSGSLQFVKTSGVAYNPSSWLGNTYPSPILNLSFTDATLNGTNYIEMTGITSFSGGTGGYAIGSPSAGGLGKSSSGAIALPVTWGTIAATAVNEGNRVVWNAESEKNTNYFEVEYSYDARQFTTASPQVKAAGNSATARSYSFLHENEYSELVYYRIKQVDLDGKADYSKMVAVKRTTKLPEFSVSFYPVPLNIEALTVKIQTGQKTDVQVQIQDLLGRTVYTQTITPAGYETTEKLNVGHLPNGTYHVTIDNGANRIDRSIVIAK